MKAGWVEKRLGDFAVTVSTGPFGSVLHKSDYVDDGVPLVNPINIVNERIVPDPTKLIDKATKERLIHYVLREGDIVVGRRGEIGRCAVVGPDESGWVCGTGSFFIRPLPSTNSQFLAHLIRSDHYREKLEQASTGATMKNLSNSTLSDLLIAVPSHSEQQRIVGILDDAFDSIAIAKTHAEANLQNARALFDSQREALLTSKHGWQSAPLADLCEVKHGYAFEGEHFAADGLYVLLTPGSFFEAGGYRERGAKTKYFVGPIPREYILGEGNLLVAMTEQAAGLLGSPLLVPEADRFLHNQRLGLVTGKTGVPWSNDFFFHLFNLERVRKEIHATASGVKVRHTSPTRIGAVQVAYPPSVDEQKKIAGQINDVADQCEALASIYRRKLTALEDLKKSLLHQAFSGQL